MSRELSTAVLRVRGQRLKNVDPNLQERQVSTTKNVKKVFKTNKLFQMVLPVCLTWKPESLMPTKQNLYFGWEEDRRGTIGHLSGPLQVSGSAKAAPTVALMREDLGTDLPLCCAGITSRQY